MHALYILVHSGGCFGVEQNPTHLATISPNPIRSRVCYQIPSMTTAYLAVELVSYTTTSSPSTTTQHVAHCSPRSPPGITTMRPQPSDQLLFIYHRRRSSHRHQIRSNTHATKKLRHALQAKESHSKHGYHPPPRTAKFPKRDPPLPETNLPPFLRRERRRSSKSFSWNPQTGHRNGRRDPANISRYASYHPHGP